MLLGELTQGLGITLLTPGAAAVRITDVTEDSRTALPGSLFIARSGRQADGRQYVLDAVAAGATAILTDDPEPLRTGNACPAAAIASTKDIMLAAAQVAERFYGNPARVLASRAGILGVTGTNGKTTITWLTWQILNRASIRCGLIGTVVIDDGREVAAATMTTPPAVELSLTLANMVEAGCQAVVLEASSHALHQRRVGALPFRVGIFTNWGVFVWQSWRLMGRAIGTLAIGKERVAKVGEVTHIKAIQFKAGSDDFGVDSGREEGVFFHDLGR